MQDTRRAADSTGKFGFPRRLRWALIAAPLLILGAGVVEFYWRFSAPSTGASLTEDAALLGALVAFVSAMLGIYRLIRIPVSRNLEAFVLTTINALVCLASFALFYFLFTSPPSGYIKVEYNGMSASGVFWAVENLSTQSIYLRGSGNAVWPGSAVTTCETSAYDGEESDAQLADGFYSAIKISPGGRLRLDVSTDLPKQFKRGHCRVRLTLEGGTFVESSDFTPE